MCWPCTALKTLCISRQVLVLSVCSAALAFRKQALAADQTGARRGLIRVRSPASRARRDCARRGMASYTMPTLTVPSVCDAYTCSLALASGQPRLLGGVVIAI